MGMRSCRQKHLSVFQIFALTKTGTVCVVSKLGLNLTKSGVRVSFTEHSVALNQERVTFSFVLYNAAEFHADT